MSRFVVTGTDTGIGKTIFSAALAGALGATYWKPVQSGITDETDSETVSRLTGAPVLPEAWRLTAPLSPHRSAELDGVTIDPFTLTPPAADPLVIEGAGGLLVPLTRQFLYADLFVRWGLPVILCARTALGTINHSLLSIEAMRARGLTIHGIAFIGEANEDNEATIAAMGGVKRLGRLPLIERLEGKALAQAFADNFDVADFG